MAEAEALKKRARKDAKVLYRAASPFGSAVSKSFKCDNCGQISSIMVHIPKFQIVQVLAISKIERRLCVCIYCSLYVERTVCSATKPVELCSVHGLFLLYRVGSVLS